MWYVVELVGPEILRIWLPVFQVQWIHLLQSRQDLTWTSKDRSLKTRRIFGLISNSHQIGEWFSILGPISICSSLPWGSQSSCCRGQSWLRASAAVPLDPPLCPCWGHTSLSYSQGHYCSPWPLKGTPLAWKFHVSSYSSLPSTFYFCVQTCNMVFHACPTSSLSSFTGIYHILSWCQLQTNTVSKIKIFFRQSRRNWRRVKSMLHPVS